MPSSHSFGRGVLLATSGAEMPEPFGGAIVYLLDEARYRFGHEYGGRAYWAPSNGTAIFRGGCTVPTALLDGTYTPIPLDTIATDLVGSHVPGSPTRVRPTFPGRFQLFGACEFAPGAAAGTRHVAWLLNGALYPGSSNNEGAEASVAAAVSPRPSLVTLNGTTDYIELAAMRVGGSGGTVPVDGYSAGVAVTYVGR